MQQEERYGLRLSYAVPKICWGSESTRLRQDMKKKCCKKYPVVGSTIPPCLEMHLAVKSQKQHNGTN